MESFTHLKAWQKGMELVKEIYALSKRFPSDERFALTSQLRRAATSVLANTAEGFSRRTPPDKANKYTIARGECSETSTFLLISVELGYVSMPEAGHAIDLAEETGKILSGLIQTYSR
ncbi:MAG: four helix bundle protein [Candidatus Peribacteraceae bacterium]|nr:four helix bundle protein [Candidatus Peribacteraceae bacterium]